MKPTLNAGSVKMFEKFKRNCLYERSSLLITSFLKFLDYFFLK